MTLPPTPFKEAAAYVMPFGMYKGQALDAIATDDRGLLWLDWLRGQRNLDAKTMRHIAAYLDDPTITTTLLLLVRK